MNNTKKILDSINTYSKQYNYDVDWNKINDKAKEILELQDKTQTDIETNNNNLLRYLIYIGW